MKRRILLFSVVVMLLAGGCGKGKEASKSTNEEDHNLQKMLETKDVETLYGWSFQENSGTDDYSLFFGLKNKKEKAVSAEVQVDIRIVNDKGTEVYTATKTVEKDDFSTYESKIAGTQYLANVRIPKKDIEPGKSADGTVFFKVYQGDWMSFDEVNCEVSYCLPIADVILESKVPVEISVKGYDGKVESVLQIQNVSYEYDKETTPTLYITVSGKKMSGKNSIYDSIAYKIYDSEGYKVDSGSIYLDAISQGDKFKDDSIIFYDVTPGENYRIEFTENEF